MSIVGQRERLTQNRVVHLFRTQLGYEYLGNWEDRRNNRNIEENYLRAHLRRQRYDDGLIDKALFELNRAAGDQGKSLYDVNKVVYGLLRYGVKVRAEAGEQTQTAWLIDWANPAANHFAIAEEVTVAGAGPAARTKRPDVVLYVNGIALGVLELKRSIVSIGQGIRQNLDNQKPEFIQPFFATVQLLMAGNDTQGLRYGVIETQEKYYLTWKEDSHAGVASPLDRHLLQLCAKERFLEIIHDFIVFDSGIKKTCRHNQYFGVKAAQARVHAREGGILWHTQGSGKSLTMVWLAKWIREHVHDARVLIITDRTELDQQIENVFWGVEEKIHRTRSGADLTGKLNAAEPWLLCSLIHKFGSAAEGDVDAYVEDLRRSLPSNFRAKGNLFVFVDECHRTQSGELHDAMKAILPNAMFIGFTGTPLLKADKKRSIEVFGSYIHTYKFDEAVQDGVVLDLLYELFLKAGFDKCAIVTSYRPSPNDIKGEETGEGPTERLRQFEIYNRMLNGKDPEAFEREAKERFVKEPGQMRLLIVVDKLLTGFDAPSATYLYIDKQMRDHGLFQAICRVNRLDGDDKDYGTIVDYKDLFKSLQTSVADYTSGALDGYDREDVAGLLKDRLQTGRARLEEAREAVRALCEPVEPPRDTPDYIRYFCARDSGDGDELADNEPKRLAFYKLANVYLRAYADMANEMLVAGYTEAQAAAIRDEATHYWKAATEVKFASGDYIDLKTYEPAMRHLIDSYIQADESKKVSAFDDVSLIQLIVQKGPAALDDLPAGIAGNRAAMAETVENNLRRVIIEEQPVNPKYYGKMSELLDALIQQRKAEALEYEAYLAELAALAKQVQEPQGAEYPRTLYSRARRALYDNLGRDEALAVALDDAIRTTKKDGWRGNLFKEREIRRVLREKLQDDAEVERIFEIVKAQGEY